MQQAMRENWGQKGNHKLILSSKMVVTLFSDYIFVDWLLRYCSLSRNSGIILFPFSQNWTTTTEAGWELPGTAHIPVSNSPGCPASHRYFSNMETLFTQIKTIAVIFWYQAVGKEGYSRCAWFILKNFNWLTEVKIMKWWTSTFRLCINPNRKMEVDSDSEQPSGSGVVAGKDKKRYCRIRITCA